ncbi:MAG TPA: tRNA (adenosine(37)-N6)-threonylcarbamoyltransferase complex dimerization subunit type 1 TsaB [Candidatus Eisenbergiella merdigallinarum]|uniref:tRNA (Adenosine(37)-N6)-threonylcarbamoyltransferase complex dimerization subunit type 1 TsaB n=1 Tax=Candidatus Eisenbergiella merdigallinarum TaxID=2838552 RepID=A0A9D2SDJ8_9FIRM|nr:tRNA (adenosine(37)-N6)-threonylcarbamoyltransferase complex dimerization subunit type 1 TsaB [Candidatus Eisenbergiella merdigallinarum]
MKILALDSSGLVASVALTDDDVLVAEYTTNYKKTHSQTLLPMLDELKRMVELDLHTVDVIAVAAGPGSFTGLRIGAATAKGLGLALNAPIAPVPTVDALAWNLYGSDRLVCPLMDARRNQVYTGIYAFERDEAGGCRQNTLLEQCALSVEEVAGRLNGLGREVIFLGDGVPVYRELLAERVKVPFSFAPACCNRQRAALVACLGAVYAREGKLVDADRFAPEYLRMSQAERERMEAADSQKEAAGAQRRPS